MKRYGKFRVYRDRILTDEVPDRRHKPGELFSRLVAVNVSSDGKVVEPVYMPLVRVQKGDGSTVIWVNSYERPLFLITLAKRWPFVCVFRYDWILLDRDD